MEKMKFTVDGQSEGFALTAKAGNHHLTMDESVNFGGKDSGPNPLQTALSSLISCENVVANMAASEMEFDLKQLSFEVTGEFDPRGFMGDPTVKPYFETVTINVSVETTESEQRVKALQEQVEARCPVYTLFKAAGVNMVDSWVKA